VAHAEEEGRAYYDFAVFAYEDGDYEDAEKNLKKALEFDPDNAFYNHYLGKTYLKMERYQEAMDYLNRAWKVDPDIPGLMYDIALVNYKLARYSRSADLFMKIADEDPSHVLAWYNAGMSLYKEKRYSKALDYFITASEGSPTIKDNGYYYAGICHMKMGDFEKAVEKFEYVRDYAARESLREYAIKSLEAIEKHKKALKAYSLFLKLGYRYDDNVRLEPLDEDTFADEADYLAVAFFSGKYNIINRQAIRAGAGYSHYQTRHQELQEFDLMGSIFNFYGNYSLGSWGFGLSYLPHYYRLGSESYLIRHEVKPEGTYRVNKDLLTKLFYSYYKNEYQQDIYKGRDGNTNEVNLDAYYSIGNKMISLFGGIGYEVNSASHDDYDYGQLKSKLGISVRFPWRMVISMAGRYNVKSYDNVDSIYTIKREDNKYIGFLSISQKLYYDWLDLIGDFRHTRNDSNIDRLGYVRNVVTLSLAVRF
jgi:tetratricopeptide (TPR) repeat protein